MLPPDELPLAPLDEAPLDAPLDEAPELAPFEEASPASPEDVPELVPEDAPDDAPLDPLPLEVVASPPLDDAPDVPEDEPFEPDELPPEAFDPSVVPSLEPPSSRPDWVPLLPPQAAAATNAANAATRTNVDPLNSLIITAPSAPRRRMDECPGAYQLSTLTRPLTTGTFAFPLATEATGMHGWSRVVIRARSCSTCRAAFVRVCGPFA
jgi:hypothetical protein